MKLNYDYQNTNGAFVVTGVCTHSLNVDTSSYNLFSKGAVGDPYIGVYAFDTIIVKGGARVQTSGMVFYNVIILNNGQFTSFTGTQTGMIEQKGQVPEDVRQASVLRKMLREAMPIIDNNNIKVASSKTIQATTALKVIGKNPEKKGSLFARIAEMFKKLFAVNKPQDDKKQAATSKVKQADTTVSLIIKKNEEKPVLVATAGVPDNTPAPAKKVCKNGDPMYTYDPLDRVTSMQTPAGNTQYHYDTITGSLDKITSPEGKQFNYGYNHGQLESLEYPNGITAHYTFDDNGNLTDLDYRKGGSSVKRYQYRYDRNGMRDTMIDNDGVHSYAYDQLYQITQAMHPTVPNPLEQFTYDSVGNRLTDMTHSAYQYNELNQLMEDDSCIYKYDLDGNQTEKINKATGDTTRFTYDIENKLLQVQKSGMLAKYAYEATGRRMAKTVNGTTTQLRYNGNNLIIEMNGNDSITASYTFGGIDKPLMTNRNNKDYYYVQDGLGSVTALTDSNATVVKQYKYSVFGVITDETGDTAAWNPFTYTSREYEKDVGIYFYRARYYDPGTGRFLSSDPLAEKGHQVLSYRYASNSPLSFADPQGLATCQAIRYMEDFESNEEPGVYIQFNASMYKAQWDAMAQNLKSQYNVLTVEASTKKDLLPIVEQGTYNAILSHSYWDQQYIFSRYNNPSNVGYYDINKATHGVTFISSCFSAKFLAGNDNLRAWHQGPGEIDIGILISDITTWFGEKADACKADGGGGGGGGCGGK